MSDFNDVTIVGFDDAATRPSGKGALLDMVLQLSTPASGSWSQIFELAWKQNMSMTKRNARVSGDTIIVTCMPDELQTQIDDLKGVVQKVNEKYRQLLDQSERIRAAQNTKAEHDRQKLQELKGNLKF